jgi:hypothetical protein
MTCMMWCIRCIHAVYTIPHGHHVLKVLTCNVCNDYVMTYHVMIYHLWIHHFWTSAHQMISSLSWCTISTECTSPASRRHTPYVYVCMYVCMYTPLYTPSLTCTPTTKDITCICHYRHCYHDIPSLDIPSLDIWSSDDIISFMMYHLYRVYISC